MLRTWWRQALVVVLFLLVASCSGGGCSSGCSSCGVTPLAGGFPQQDGVTNAAAVRVTRPGLDFIGQSLPSLASKLLGGSSPGVVTFNVPTTNTSTKILGLVTVDISICPNGPAPNATPPECIAEVEIGRAVLRIDSLTPHAVQISGTIPVRLRDLPVTASIIGGLDLALGTNLQCTNGVADADFANIPVSISLPLVGGTAAPRQGYTTIDTKNAVVNVGLTQDDLQICSHCASVFSGVCDAFFGIVKGLIFSPLQSQIGGIITNALGSAFCTKSNPALTPSCPTGSHPDAPDGGGPVDDAGVPTQSYTCVYDTDPTTCVPTELGIDGHIDLSSLLKSISPGTTGALDFVLASGGDMDPAPGHDAGANGQTDNGITLGMLGGALPQPQSVCVPPAPNPVPQAIPVPEALKGDTLDGGWSAEAGPHVEVALNGRFLNYAMGSVYNSGLLCLGVSTENFQQLNTGLVSLLISSMKDLTFEEKAAPIAITTRPQKPPIVAIGGGTNIDKDPLLSITLPKFAIDFYVWSSDRYVRAFTYESDIQVPVNLDAQPAGIKPTLGKLNITNGVVSNEALLTDDPKAVGDALTSVIGGLVGQLLGNGISPINLSNALSSLGLTLDIPAGGIRRLSEGSEQWVGIFANLATPASPSTLKADTEAHLVNKVVHPEAMQLTTARADTMPYIDVALSSSLDDGAHAVEYSWRLDQGPWSVWSAARTASIHDDVLFFQAKHVLQVAARLAGHAETEDPTPAEVTFAIDVIPPAVRFVGDEGAKRVEARDIVSPASALVGRLRYGDASGAVGPWSEWTAMSMLTLDPAAHSVDVEVKDEEGNVGSVSSALIRGRPDGSLATGSGCANGCTTGASGRTEWPALLLAVAAVALLFARRRGAKSHRATTAALALGSVVAVAGSTQGCGCGDDGGAAAPKTGCGSDCNQACLPGLPLGLIGSYTSIAKSKDGSIWVAGYNDAVVDNTASIAGLYGDLVVGRYDQGRQAVQWVTVDGLPPAPTDGTCVSNDPNGWRHGLLDSGDDVGLWTSIAMDINDHPMVAYYDATNGALKFATSNDGTSWSTHAILANLGSDVGRYAKLLVVDGKPAVAFATLEKGTGGHTRSKVSVAHGNVPTPAGPGDWTIEDALVDNNGPCRASTDCDGSNACVGGTCTATVKGCSGCSATQACVTQNNAPTCANVLQGTELHPYPNGVGLYIAMAVAPQGLAIVAYDRIHGNLMGLSNAGGAWKATILDGETGSRSGGTAVDTGDDGIGASLFVATNGDWHVTYVNGLKEALYYLHVPGGKPVTGLVPQLVDDGSKVDGQAFTDGIHVVGDDSFVRASDDGTVVVTYQDATAGTLRIATGAVTGTKWDLHQIKQPGRFAGFFPRFVPGDTTIANWWRASDAVKSEFGDVAIVPAL